jgi:hypothetical protein
MSALATIRYACGGAILAVALCHVATHFIGVSSASPDLDTLEALLGSIVTIAVLAR